MLDDDKDNSTIFYLKMISNIYINVQAIFLIIIRHYFIFIKISDSYYIKQISLTRKEHLSKKFIK